MTSFTSNDTMIHPSARMLRGAWVLMGLAGLVGLWTFIQGGHHATGYGSYAPWGLWVAIYFHGVGLAGGVFAVHALGLVLGWEGFQSVAKLRATIVLSLAALLPGLLAIWIDLGSPLRFPSVYLFANFSSMLAFNAWMYALFMVLCGVLYALSWSRSAWLKPLVAATGVIVVMFPSQSGAFFAVVGAKPFWSTGLTPVLFLASSLTAGMALLLVASALSSDGQTEVGLALIRRLRGGIVKGLAIYAFFEFAEISIHVWNPAHASGALDLVLWGPYWWVFWGVHLVLGMVIPMFLLSRSKPTWWWVAALLVAICSLTSRLNVLVPGMATGDLLSIQEAFQHPKLNYVYQATPVEYLVGFFLVAFGMAIFRVGREIDGYLSNRLSGAERD